MARKSSRTLELMFSNFSLNPLDFLLARLFHFVFVVFASVLAPVCFIFVRPIFYVA